MPDVAQRLEQENYNLDFFFFLENPNTFSMTTGPSIMFVFLLRLCLIYNSDLIFCKILQILEGQ